MAPCDLGTDWVGVCSVCYSALKDPSPALTFPDCGEEAASCLVQAAAARVGRAKSGLELLIGAYFYFYFVFLVCEVNLINGTDFGNDVLVSPFPLCTECLPFYPDRAGLCCSAGKQVSRYILFLPAGQSVGFHPVWVE